MSLQKTSDGPKMGPHNQRLKNAIKHLKSTDILKKETKEIAEITGYNKSTVSEYIRGIEPASSTFEKEFENKFGISLENFANVADDNTQILGTKGVKVTLQDYIDLLKDTNDKLFAIVNSTLSQIHEDSRYSVAYQKAWVKYEAERSSGGDKQKEAEVNYKLNKLVDDVIENDDESGSPGETDKIDKEGQ